MPEPIDDTKELSDPFTEEYNDNKQKNRRSAVRYVREDITAIFLKKGLIKSTEVFVKLLDISSKGALITCSIKITVKNKVTLRLIFKDGKKFNLEATVIHIGDPPGKQCGLKFNKVNNKLGDYLLLTQSDLVFK